MQHEYRGHRICLIAAEHWTAQLVELATGAVLPTMVVATPGESFRDVAARARKLVDIYVDTQTRSVRVMGPARPWVTILP